MGVPYIAVMDGWVYYTKMVVLYNAVMDGCTLHCSDGWMGVPYIAVMDGWVYHTM